jgi:FXSXX-COOH protein
MTVLDEPKFKSGLIDVSRIPLRDLMSPEAQGFDALDEAIRRVTDNAENESQKSVSAFNSAI